jgi:ribosomal-protein-alanine N-acetyltransferase
MSPTPRLHTQRLLLRAWQASDRAPYAALNADPAVREFFPERLGREQSDAQIAVFEDHFAQHGFGMWALAPRATGELIGFTGLDLATYEAHFARALRVGAWLCDRGSARRARIRLRGARA